MISIRFFMPKDSLQFFFTLLLYNNVDDIFMVIVMQCFSHVLLCHYAVISFVLLYDHCPPV